jgi:hypothetical protein
MMGYHHHLYAWFLGNNISERKAKNKNRKIIIKLTYKLVGNFLFTLPNEFILLVYHLYLVVNGLTRVFGVCFKPIAG